jgi:MOSC domain-containing protein YiiM
MPARADPDLPSHPTGGQVVSVSSSAGHEFSKQPRASIRLLQGLGVEGDAHLGTTVQHLSRVRRDPTQPNLRQVHLMHHELLAQANTLGHPVRPGDLGENVTTSGVDLLGLPTGTILRLGEEAEVELSGLRNPCRQIDDFQPGLLQHMLDRADDGTVVRKAGVMAVVRRSGLVRPGDHVHVVLPSPPHRPLTLV